MALAIKYSREEFYSSRVCHDSDWHKSRAVVPSGRCRGIDIPRENIAAAERMCGVTADRLQLLDSANRDAVPERDGGADRPRRNVARRILVLHIQSIQSVTG